MDEHAPPIGADQPLDRHPSAVGPELIAALTVPHPIGRTLAIELRSALAEPEQRSLGQLKPHARSIGVEDQPLHGVLP